MRNIAIAIIDVYQKHAHLPQVFGLFGLLYTPCKFYPSCSEYAKEALDNHGLVQGSWRAVKRIAKCNPLT